LLDKADTTYVLKTDVRSLRTAFIVAAAKVTLDLNGHKVIYGDGEPVKVRNGGFEEGDGTVVPGWNVTGAPQAVLAPNRSLLFGNKVLKLTAFTKAQQLISEPINLSESDRQYVATITPAQAVYGTQLEIVVRDAASNKILGQGRSEDTERGFSAVATFVPTSLAIRLQVDVTPPKERPGALDLDEATVAPASDYGIMATTAWRGDIPGLVNLPTSVRNYYQAARSFTLKNGKVIQGRASGYGCVPLFFRELPGLVIDNIETQVRGVDTVTVDATAAAGDVSIINSRFVETVPNITNRMRTFATLTVGGVKGRLWIEGNHILGSPQMAIKAGGNDPRYRLVIRHNEIRQNAVTTNAYAILLSAARNFVIEDNQIVPNNGRGIDLDGYDARLMADGVIRKNYVEVQELPHREDPSLEARALRLRNNVDAMGPHRNLQIQDNTFIAKTGPGFVARAFSVRISYVNKQHQMDDAQIVFNHNVIRGVVATADPKYRAYGLVLDGIAPGIRPKFFNNTIESNDVSLAITEGDGGSVNDVLLESNTIRQTADTPTRAYTDVLAGFYNREIHTVLLLDTHTEKSAGPKLQWAGTGLKDLAVGYLLNLSVQDRSNKPLPGAIVRILDGNHQPMFEGKTDAKGQLDGIPLIISLYSQKTDDPKAISTEAYNPFTVRLEAGSLKAEQQVQLDASQSIKLVARAPTP
jgi:hypothetical protein